MIQSVLNKDVSCFASCDSAVPKRVNLLHWLTSDKYREKVEELRAIQDESLQKSIKKTLPAITPSGLFEYRNAGHLIEHSGLLTFDIDFDDNRHITNFQDMRSQLSNIPNVAYCGLSVRGRGFWGAVPVPKSTPDAHSQRFQALENDFKEIGIVLDPSCKDVCRLRIYSWDPEAFFNHDAKLYTKLFVPIPKQNNRPVFSDTRERVERIISNIIKTGTDLTGTYEGWLKIACSFANEFGESGRGYFHIVSRYHREYNVARTDRMFDAVLKHDYRQVTIASFFKIAQDYGLRNASEKQVINSAPVKSNEDKEMNRVKTPSTTFKRGPWTEEIESMEKFFEITPSGPIHLNQCETIINPSLFIRSHIDTLKGQNGNERYIPYLERMRELKKILQN